MFLAARSLWIHCRGKQSQSVFKAQKWRHHVLQFGGLNDSRETKCSYLSRRQEIHSFGDLEAVAYQVLHCQMVINWALWNHISMTKLPTTNENGEKRWATSCFTTLVRVTTGAWTFVFSRSRADVQLGHFPQTEVPFSHILISRRPPLATGSLSLFATERQ